MNFFLSFVQRFRALLGAPPAGLDITAQQAFARNRVALWSVLFNAMNKGLGMALVLAAIAWSVPYLGAAQTGAWLTILSLVAVLGFLDMGLGNAMTNRAAAALVQGHAAVRSEVSAGLLLVAGLSALIVLGLGMLVLLAPWPLLFKLPDQTSGWGHAQIELTLWVFVMLFGLQVWANAAIRSMAGLQQAPLAYGLQAAMGVVALGLLALASQVQAGMPWLLACVMAPPIATGLVLALLLWRKGQLGFRAGLAALPGRWRALLNLGGYFFVLQVCATLGWGADALIVSSTLGVAAVAPFALCQRLFQFASQPVSIVVAPLWPAYADAHARSDHAYVRRLLVRSMGLAAVAGAGLIALLVLLSPWVFTWLAQGEIQVPVTLVLLFGLWVFLELMGNTFAMFLNGVGLVRLQAIIATVFVLFAMPAKIWAVQVWGLHGLLGSAIVLYVALVVLPYCVLLSLGRLRGTSTVSSE